MKFGTVIPMEPIRAGEPPDGEYVHEVKWDGIRMLAFYNEGEVQLQNRRLNNRSGVYPEVEIIKQIFNGKSVILDGEIVAVRNGRPSFYLTLRREQAAGSGSVKTAAANYPIIYMIFDLLFFAGRDLRTLALCRRREILENCLTQTNAVRLVTQYRDGKELFLATGENRLEGIVSKNINSVYVPGKSREWVKVKHRRRLAAVVGGYFKRNRQPVSLLLGMYKNDLLVYIGRVSSGLSSEQWSALALFFKETETAESPFANSPRGKGLEWLYPSLVVNIEYQEWTEKMMLRNPVITGFSKDDPADCRIDDL